MENKKKYVAAKMLPIVTNDNINNLPESLKKEFFLNTLKKYGVEFNVFDGDDKIPNRFFSTLFVYGKEVYFKNSGWTYSKIDEICFKLRDKNNFELIKLDPKKISFKYDLNEFLDEDDDYWYEEREIDKIFSLKIKGLDNVVLIASFLGLESVMFYY